MEGGVVDPLYEFCAPQYHDFSQQDDAAEQLAAETWFDMKTVADDISPQVAKKHAGQSQPLTSSTLKPVTRSAATKVRVEEAFDNSTLSLQFASPARAWGTPSRLVATPAGKLDAVLASPGSHTLQRAITRSMRKTVEREAIAQSVEKASGSADGQFLAAGPQSIAEEADLLPAKRLYSELRWSDQSNVGSGRRTTPRSPKLHTARRVQRSSSEQKNTEEARMLQVLQEAEQARKRRKVENEKLKEILAAKGPLLPPRSAAPLTVPEEVHLHTEERALQRGDTAHMQLRSGKYVSTAELVEQFHKKTPERFHSKPRSQDHPVLDERQPLGLTRPVEPELATSTRLRPRVQSSEEIEEAVLRALPPFKARPFSSKVRMSCGDLGLPKVEPARLTQPEGFHLRVDERAKLHPSPVLEEEHVQTRSMARAADVASSSKPQGLTLPKSPLLETKARARPSRLKSREELEMEALAAMPKFRARPLSVHVLESCGDLGVPKVVPAPVTVPEAFHLAVDARLGPHPSELPSPKKRKWGGDQSAPPLHTHDLRPRITSPQPFDLRTEERGSMKASLLEVQQAAREAAERAKRNKVAQPLPYTTDVPQKVHKPMPKGPTEPEPFALESVARHEAEVAARKHEEELRLKREKHRRFKALPNLSKDVQPFVPERSRQPLTEVQEPVLQVELRAPLRAEFDKKVEEKEKLAAAYRAEYEAERKAMEEEQIKLMRKEMVHHARPLPTFDHPFVPQKSRREPTKPMSPRLLKKSRQEQTGAVSGMR